MRAARVEHFKTVTGIVFFEQDVVSALRASHRRREHERLDHGRVVVDVFHLQNQLRQILNDPRSALLQRDCRLKIQF